MNNKIEKGTQQANQVTVKATNGQESGEWIDTAKKKQKRNGNNQGQEGIKEGTLDINNQEQPTAGNNKNAIEIEE